MEATEDLAAARIRERPVRRAPWTFRCHRPEHDVYLDVDAFDERDAARLAAAHWDMDADLVHVEGKRRRWLRWIGLSTHDAGDSEVGRGWWIACKIGFAIVVGVAITVPVVSPIGDGLREQRELGMAVKRAELERLEAEKAGALPASESE
ncbi:MAG: hypothetical protein OXQ29_05665 [Rhodospirillaceae bacterium]|nr:hypothetical protein [Rhodospirillaceae bacterium]